MNKEAKSLKRQKRLSELKWRSLEALELTGVILGSIAFGVGAVAALAFVMFWPMTVLTAWVGIVTVPFGIWLGSLLVVWQMDR